MPSTDVSQFQVDWTRFIPNFESLRLTPNDVIDILIVAYLIYRVMKILKDTSAERLIKGVIVLAVGLFAATQFQLTTIAYLLKSIFLWGVFVLAVIFQPELRQLLEHLGKGNVSKLFTPKADPDEIESAIDATVAACEEMSRQKTGVLIVFEREKKLGEVIRTGTYINAATSTELLKNIFYPKSPLHDGAVVMRDGKVCAAACVLPLSNSQNLSRDLGTRHRAAVGMSEISDSVVVIVSEETGAIAVAIGGMLKRYLTPELLRKILQAEFLHEETEKKSSSLRDFWKGGKSK